MASQIDPPVLHLISMKVSELIHPDVVDQVYEIERQNVLHEAQPIDAAPSLPKPIPDPSNSQITPDSQQLSTSKTLNDLRSALTTMQDLYFELWVGKWTTAMDWTAAVMGTYVSATLSTLSRSSTYTMSGTSYKDGEVNIEAQMIDDEINKYFGQSAASYYGEEAFSIRMQAYDDILWVVLEWLEGIRFIDVHSSAHYAFNEKNHSHWHGQQFIPTFAHRARVFYDLAEQGWDWHLCGGGLTWNPRLLPYKNAITNQLFISASISMYLRFPGDSNSSPLLAEQRIPDVGETPKTREEDTRDEDEGSDRGRYNPIFRQNAINGYDWLKNSGMLNDQGLYTDGFHIHDYRNNKSATTCDERNEMVYTYNQGVILSGLRGLWEATGNSTYLSDGHELVKNVIKSTGYHHKHRSVEGQWSGLGSNGILAELCDPSGSCNQDGQTFKGIFFHHLTAFCEPLPIEPVEPGSTHGATKEFAKKHLDRCNSYTPWVVRNAKAALATRDAEGRFGAWWRAPYHSSSTEEDTAPLYSTIPDGALDYRNFPALLTNLDIDPETHSEGVDSTELYYLHKHGYANTKTTRSGGDLNDRGRGRTVETQGSGLAVVRAMYEFLKL
jgi:hypothetical protein